jgi:hypothetical protein
MRLYAEVAYSRDSTLSYRPPRTIGHDRLVFWEERIEQRTIVKLTPRFQFIVRNGITRYDQDKIVLAGDRTRLRASHVRDGMSAGASIGAL